MNKQKVFNYKYVLPLIMVLTINCCERKNTSAPSEFFDAARFAQKEKLEKFLPTVTRADIYWAFDLSCAAGNPVVRKTTALDCVKLYDNYLIDLFNMDERQKMLNRGLCSAARYGHQSDVMAHLICKGADVHTNEDAPLRYAAASAIVFKTLFDERAEPIKTLIAYGANYSYLTDSFWYYNDPKGLKRKVLDLIDTHKRLN